jgi:hypothetical protein
MKKQFNAGKVLFALAMIIGLSNTFIGTAHADDWQDHERAAREWHKRHIHQQWQPAPDVVYAPPVIVEPAPTINVPLSGMNIVIPLNFR